MLEKFTRSCQLVLLLASVLFVILGAGATAQTASVSTAPTESTALPDGLTREELEELIREKSEALEKVNRELETTEGNLKTTQQEKANLQRQLRTLEQNVRQLELNIQSDEITGQKLGLEIDSLSYDIRDIEISVGDKKNAVAHLLKQLQRRDRENFLTIFLRNESLASGVLEAQSLNNLRAQLTLDIDGLRSLRGQLEDKVGTVNVKKTNIELHKKNLVSRKLIIEDQKEERSVILTQTKSKESLYEKQLEELEKQQGAIADEIDKVEDELRRKFDVSILPVKRPGVFAWPVVLVGDGGAGRITQHFGERSRLYRGKPHNGLDIGAPIGTPVFAADDGVVMAVDDNDRSRWNKYQYGKYALIRHPNSLATLYAHLSRQVVSKGMEVKRGDLIGYSGSTGYATGPHLHFGAYWAPSIVMKAFPPAAGFVPIGVAISPEDYL